MRAALARAAALGLLALAAMPALAAGDSVLVLAGETACAFGAWLDGEDDRPVPVRAAPSDEAEILGTLPVEPSGETVYEYPIQFDLVAARDGWLKITRADDSYNSNAGAPVRPVFQGEGWIPSRLARLGIQSGRGHAGPSPDSRRILDFPGRWLTEVGRIERILGCNGEWILLEVSIGPLLGPDGQSIPLEKRESTLRTAWFRGVCSNMATTCDRREIDDDPPK